MKIAQKLLKSVMPKKIIRQYKNHENMKANKMGKKIIAKKSLTTGLIIKKNII